MTPTPPTPAPPPTRPARRTRSSGFVDSITLVLIVAYVLSGGDLDLALGATAASAVLAWLTA